MRHDPLVSVIDMIQAIQRALDFAHGRGRTEFLSDTMLRYAIWAQIVILGEAVRRIPEEWKEKRNELPWNAIAGMRNRLVHGYDVIDWEIVWAVATKEMPNLLATLRKALDEETRSRE